MGSYSQITFGGYPLFSNKNSFYSNILDLIFLTDDFVCENRKYSSRNKLVWGDAYEKNRSSFKFKGYLQIAKVCRERLKIFGNSYKRAKLDFNVAKRTAKQEFHYDFAVSGLTYDKYLKEIGDIIDSKEIHYEQKYTNLRDGLISDELVFYGQSLDCALYSILSVLPDDAEIEYDLSDIISGGWVNDDSVKLIDNEKIIILTEGKTDVEFISNSIEKFYPHLKHYYHFIDFDEYKVESNASALVKIVTSFAAANVKHPIIALFDNDTTGLMEMKRLKAKPLPRNIRVLKYPDILLAKKYPTIGPTQSKKMNVNGFACGIELYLGPDVLTKNGSLIPILWKGFNEKENKYQGEISEKQYVQDAFRKKLSQDSVLEWKEINQLLNVIFNAFD